MQQHMQLSEVAQAIVSKLKKSLTPQGHFSSQMVASLYALRPEAEPRLVQALSGQIIDLSEHLDTKEVASLQAEFPALLSGEAWDHPTKDPIGDTVELGAEIAKLCADLTQCTEGDSVYYPHAGSGSFLLDLGLDYGGKGFESNETLWAISQIRLKTLGHSAEISLGEPELGEQRFDRIFMPLRLTADRKVEKNFAEELTSLGSEHLAEGGLMACVLLPGFAFHSHGHWRACRQAIVEAGLSLTLISLPNRLMLPYTSVGLCVLVLHNDKQGQIRLVDASDSRFVSKKHVGYRLELEAVKTLLSQTDSDKVWQGHASELNDKASLWPGDYLSICHASMLREGEQFYTLSDLVELIDTKPRGQIQRKLRCLRLSNLNLSFLACDIEAINLPWVERPARHFVTEDCLLFAYLEGRIKVGRLIGASPEQPVALIGNIFAFRLLRPDLITQKYLLRALSSGLSYKQADALAKGTALRRFESQEFLSLQVIVPDSLDQQNEEYHAEAVEAMRQAGLDVELCQEEFRRDMHLKKHAIGQSLFNLNNWWTLLKMTRQNHHGRLEDTMPLGEGSPLTVADVYTNLESIISKLSKQLSKFDTGYGLSKTEFDLLPFLQSYIAKHQNPVFNLALTAINETMPCPVLFSTEALAMVLDNILSNAATHGFGGQAQPRNTVRIELSQSGTDYIVSVSNNGRPLREDFCVQDVFRYGQSSGESHQHCGIGGYEVFKLMREFGATVEFISTPEAEYPVEYRLIFHSTNI